MSAANSSGRGWDYLGEPTPYYSSRSSYFGIIDLAGFKKDRFYLYQAHWRSGSSDGAHPAALDLARARRAGHPRARLHLGRRSRAVPQRQIARQRKKGRIRISAALGFDVVYEPGTLEVVAYKNGKRWATDLVTTAGAAARLAARRRTARRSAPTARDLSFVTVRVLGREGHCWCRARTIRSLHHRWAGRDRGHRQRRSDRLAAFPSHERRAFNGMALVIVRAKPGQSGRIVVTASADGMQSGKTVVDLALLPP